MSSSFSSEDSDVEAWVLPDVESSDGRGQGLLTAGQLEEIQKQAYAEGFDIMKAKEEFNLDLHQIAEIWRYGSVVRSWLLDLTSAALSEDEDLEAIKAWVPDSGEGRWTVFEAIDLNVSAPVITASLQRRLRSRAEQPFADKLLAALRKQFGGHAVKHAEE